MKTDEELIRQYLKGDEASLEALVKKYLPLIYGFARQYTGSSANASDIAQETFVKAWRNIKKFDTKKSFKPWLFTIAKNTALDWLRKREDVPFSAFEIDGVNTLLESVVDTKPTPEIVFENARSTERIKQMLHALPENYKSVVSIRYNSELTFREIAESLKTPINTVKSRYRRALLLLRKRIGNG
jgi:RNA polymerase sigma-70 factor (ECF subfamily)